ncbi:MAG TPA: enoyl-CoA hydratase-related protein [Actinomycetota bacterium]|nr:enoyl-CoA hydratase-related protein [Actinomycetota bacterium]
MPEYSTLLWKCEGHVATITLNRPEKKNAISAVMFDELRAAFEHAGADAAVRCVVVTGAGDGFCSGADLGDPGNAPGSAFELRDRMTAIHAVAKAFIDCPKATIAKVTGIAAGAGCNLALGCDLIVASTDASFAELFVKRGLIVDFGGTWALSRALPLHRAKELALLGETVSAVEAERLGMLNRLCEPDEIDAVVDDLAQRIAALPPRSVSLIKENLNRSFERSLTENLDAESLGQALVFSTDDTREAVTAWLEKREPRFTGR